MTDLPCSPDSLTVPASHSLVSIALTMECNHRCLYCGVSCHPGGGRRDRMSFRDWTRVLLVLRRAYGTKEVHILGGEPFTSPFCLDLIRWCHEEGFKVCVFSNGTLLTREHLTELARLGTGLGISIQSGNRTTTKQIAGFDGHDATLETIRLARELNVNLFVVSMRLTKANAHTEKEARQAMFALGVSKNQLDFAPARAIGRAIKLRDAGDDSILDAWEPECQTCNSGHLHIESSGDLQVCFVWPYSAGNLKPDGIMLNDEEVVAMLRSTEFAVRLEEMRQAAHAHFQSKPERQHRSSG